MITIYTSEEIEKIAAAGKLTADTLSMLERQFVRESAPWNWMKWRRNLSAAEAASRAAKAMRGFQEVSAPLSTIQLSMGSLLPERF